MKAKSFLSLIGYSLIIGTLGFFTRMIDGIDLITLVFFRTFLAALFILGFLLITKRAADLIPSNLALLLFSAICQGGMMVTFIGAILYTSISNTVFINHTAPIFAIIFSKIFLKEEILKSTIFSIFVSFAGMLLIIDVTNFSMQSSTAIGDMLALVSGICFAGAMVSAKSLTRTNASSGIAFWQMAITSAALFPFIQLPSAPTLLTAAYPLIGLGCFATGFSYILLMIGVKNLEAQVVLIIPTIGLIFPAIGAWLVYAEALSIASLLGCALILAGVLSSQMNFGRFVPSPRGGLQPSPVT